MIYSDDNRGKIQNRQYAKQLVDFSGVRYGNITPTDIDGLIEYKDKCFVIYEFKHKNAELPYGQRLALERLANAVSKSGKEVVVFICSHDSDSASSDIYAADTRVVETFYDGKWQHRNGTKTAKESTDSFFEWIKDKQ